MLSLTVDPFVEQMDQTRLCAWSSILTKPFISKMLETRLRELLSISAAEH